VPSLFDAPPRAPAPVPAVPPSVCSAGDEQASELERQQAKIQPEGEREAVIMTALGHRPADP
jgi:hypothetical protein